MNPRKSYFNFLFVLFVLLTMIFSSEKTEAQTLSYKSYTVESGLPSNFLYYILQDRKGFIWISSEAGISRFDGQKFTNFTPEVGLPETEILKLFEDNLGRIWYLTLNGRTGFIDGNKIDPQPKLNQIINDKIRNIDQDWDNRMVFATAYRGLCTWKDGTLGTIPFIDNSNPHLHSVKFAFSSRLNINKARKEIYFITSGAQLFLTKNNKTSELKDFTIHKEAGTRDFITKNHSCAYTLIDGPFGAVPNGIWVYDPGLGVRNIITGKDVEGKICLSYLEDSKGNTWVGTVDGMYHFEHIGDKYVKKKFLLAGSRVSCIMEDNEGSIWAGSLGTGLSLFPSSEIGYMGRRFGLSDLEITDVVSGLDKQLYIATDQGFINLLKKDTITFFKATTPKIAKQNKPYDRITDLMISKDGLLWVAKDCGILAYDKANLKYSSEMVAVKKLADSYDKEVWIAFGMGLKKTRDRTAAFSENGNEEIASERTSAIHEDAFGTLWYSVESGFYKYRKGCKPIRIKDAKQLLNERITCIRSDGKGEIWMATQGKGLIRYKDGKIINISTKQGLCNNFCNSLFLQGDSIAWIATNGGISKIMLDRTDRKKFTIKNLNINHGLIADKISSIAVIGNMVYAGSSKGLILFDQTKIHTNSQPPKTYITEVKILEKDTQLLKHYDLAYRENNIKISFVGLAYRCLGSVTYKYKMEGIDQNWITSTYNTASYPSLPPGDYTFMVKAINEDGTESIETVKVEFSVSSPFWQTWWFWAAFSVIIIGIASLIFNTRLKNIANQFRLKQIALTHEQKALRAQMNPHFIFNALSSIRYYMIRKDIQTADAYLSKFASLIRQILDASKHSFISIDDEINMLHLYIELEALRFDDAFDYTIEVDPLIDKYNTEIPTMTIQPYVENAIWHGLLHKPSRGKLLIRIFRKNDNLACIIEDNGIGRKKSKEIAEKSTHKKHRSVGMEITESRLNSIAELHQSAYSVSITDLTNEYGEASGTRVELIFGKLK